MNRLKQEKEATESRIEEVRESREKSVSALAEARDRVETLERDRQRQEKEYRDAVQRENNANQAMTYCQSVPKDDARALPTVIQTALNFPKFLTYKFLPVSVFEKSLFSSLTYIPRYLNLKRLIFWMRSQNDFRSHSVVRTVFSFM